MLFEFAVGSVANAAMGGIEVDHSGLGQLWKVEMTQRERDVLAVLIGVFGQHVSGESVNRDGVLRVIHQVAKHCLSSGTGQEFALVAYRQSVFTPVWVYWISRSRGSV